ncbi:MAG: histidine kinase N-terminal 7TM domain-containing protein [Halobellus sp.]|uniref:histidine kinase N-terminal 7TM domain-containing protein n=1 Tax=Halobellus sp. TaxID=1979212 RepID=UPI0035D417F7
METHGFLIYILPILISVLSSALLSIIAWRHREYQYARSLIVLLLAVTWWSLTYVVGLSTTIPALKRFAYSLTYPAVGLVSIAWFVFAAQYTGRLRTPTKREFAALAVVPILTAVAGFTNQYHGLLWSSVDIVSRGQLEIMQTSPGALFWIHTLQSYALIGLGTAVIVLTTLLSDEAYRSEAFALVLAATFPLIVNILYLTGVIPTVDLTPAAFSLSGTLLIAATFRDQFLQTLPLAREVARDELIRQMSSPVIVTDKRSRVMDVNPAAESLTDATVDIVGTHIETVFPDISDAVDTGNESSQRTDVIQTNGEAERYYEVEKLPLHRDGGAVRGYLLRLYDVTELKDKQNELLEERQFIEQTLDALDDLFYVVDVDGNVTRWNEQFINITDYSESELEEIDALEFFPEKDQKTIADAIETAFADGEVTVEADLRTAHGQHIPHEFTGARLEDEDGRTTGLVGIGRDISERKARERRLRTFREAVENAGRMIYWMDSDGTVEYVNPAFEAQTNCDASKLIGEQTFPLADRAQSGTLTDEILDTLTHGETWQAEFMIGQNNGERRTIDQTLKPVYNNGEIERFIGVAGDITEKKRQKQQISVLQRILRHDLRNNLNVILLSVQLAKQEAANGPVRQHLDGAEKTITETLSLSQDIKQFEQAFESGEVDNRVVDIVEITREQLATLRAERTDVAFSVELPGTALVETNDLIKRAIRNVLRNAVEHNDSDTPTVTVALRSRPEKGEVELRITDNGPGIPDETVEVLNAEQESQLDHLSGFGLWAAQWALTFSGGRLEFAKNEPRGTVAKLVLPIAQATDHHRKKY